MAERVVVRRRKNKFDHVEFERTFIQWSTFKSNEESAKKEKEKLRPALLDIVAASGIEDDKGSQILAFSQPLSVANKEWTALKRERRVSLSFLEDEATAWLKSARLLSKVQVKITTTTQRPGEEAEVEERTYLDQDLVYVLNQEGKIPDDVLDSFFVENETWAIVPVRG